MYSLCSIELANLLHCPGELLLENFLQTFLLWQLALLETGGAQVKHTLQCQCQSLKGEKYYSNLCQILFRMSFNPISTEDIFQFLFLSLSLNSKRQISVLQ